MSDKLTTAVNIGSKDLAGEWGIECPWCQKLQDPKSTEKIVGKYSLSDMGRDKMHTEKCDACGEAYALCVKNISFRVVRAKI